MDNEKVVHHVGHIAPREGKPEILYLAHDGTMRKGASSLRHLFRDYVGKRVRVTIEELPEKDPPSDDHWDDNSRSSVPEGYSFG